MVRLWVEVGVRVSVIAEVSPYAGFWVRVGHDFLHIVRVKAAANVSICVLCSCYPQGWSYGNSHGWGTRTF